MSRMDSPIDEAPRSCRPFLKWPGGKRWIAPLLDDIIREDLDGTYYEPFAGAAAVFLSLQPSRAVLSDVNRDLIKCLSTVRQHPEAVVRGLRRLSNTSDCYYRVRRSQPRTSVGEAVRFVYLNRTCWGGLYRLNRNGDFNVPFGDSGRPICRRGDIVAAASALESATLRHAEFGDVLPDAGRGDVVYADPPYTTRGQDNGFVRYNEVLFKWDDQERLAREAKRAATRGALVVVSGLWHPDLLRLYQGWWALRISRSSRVSRSPAGRRLVREAVLFSRLPSYYAGGGEQELCRLDLA